ncbi:hypothetical protein R80B4_01120 [Fibrobacteres bacterium R8-0-B4]
MSFALCDVVEQPDRLAEYYASKGIHSDADKIKCLTEDMGILSTRREADETESEVLEGLQELAVLGYWRNNF